MKRRNRTVKVTERGSTIVLSGYKVAELAREAGLRPIYNGVAKGWVTDTAKLVDFVAYCEYRNVTVTIRGEAA